MENKFLNGLKEEANWKKTENNADAKKTSGSDVLDFFSTGGSLRNRDVNDIVSKVIKSWDEDPELTLKTLFYLRDIRGGQGEKRIFRTSLAFLAEHCTETIKPLLHLIPEYGRWDDIFAVYGTKLERKAIDIIKQQLDSDLENLEQGGTVSLLAKWLKSISTSSKQSREIALRTLKGLGMTRKEYRKTISLLRKHIDVVEQKMTDKKWKDIDYENVPSLAMLNYRNAFARNDSERFDQFLDDVKKGTKEIKTGALYPYDPIRKMYDDDRSFSRSVSSWFNYDEVAEAQWKNLKDFIEGPNAALVVADTSASMTRAREQNIRPIFVALGLAIYFAERNEGPYKDKMITFSQEPNYVELKGKTLYEKLKGIDSIIENTDIEAVMELVLKTAVDNNLKQEDLPKSILIISDMEFDQPEISWDYERTTYQEKFVQMFEENGYRAPIIVYWNVETRNDTFHTSSGTQNTVLVSGSSPSVVDKVMRFTENGTPYGLMLEVLQDNRYEPIKLIEED